MRKPEYKSGGREIAALPFFRVYKRLTVPG